MARKKGYSINGKPVFDLLNRPTKKQLEEAEEVAADEGTFESLEIYKDAVNTYKKELKDFVKHINTLN